MADYAITTDGEKVDTSVTVEVVNDDTGCVKRVIINGIDMTYWIASDGFAIRPGNWQTRVDLTLVAKHVTFRTE